MSIGILKTITVDFSDDAVYQYVAVKSEEVFSRVIEVILMNDGAEYIIPQGTTARLEARKSDNVPILIDGTIDYTLNRIYFSLTPKCTEIPGVIQCEIALYGEDNRLAISSFFYIDVHRSVLSGTGSANGCGNNVVSSSPEYEAFRTGLLALDDKIKQSNEVVGVVQKQMEEAREALDIAAEAAETIVTARDEAFLAAESANNSASLANEATQAANEAVKTIDGVAETATKAADEATLATQEAERIATAVVTAENARVVAEQERVSNETTRKNDEAKRVIAENNRVAAETARVEAEKLRVRESADAVDDAIDAATAANAASQNANNAIANLNTAINNANVAASYANQAAENVITTNGKMIAAEAERESAEETRQANESTRINQENARVDAELERESAFATAISNAETATQNANDAAQTAIEASQEASLQEAREAAISASESANAAADRATSFLDDAEANEEIRKSNEISRVSAEENRRTEFATWEIELGKISAFDKRIENLEAAVSPGLVTPTVDDSVAYIKNVPTGALPNAMISEIGGMTRKCTNLIPYPYAFGESYTVNGITVTLLDDGGVKLEGTATTTTHIPLAINNVTLKPGAYFLSGGYGSYNNCVLYCANPASWLSDNTWTFDTEITVGFSIYVKEGYTVSRTIYPMLNEGETALPYEPYFEGLRDAKVTAVESVGVNLFDIEKRSNGSIDSNGDLKLSTGVYEFYKYQFEENTRYTISGYVKNDSRLANLRLTFVYTDGTTNNHILSNNTTEWTYLTATSEEGKTLAYIGTYYGSSGEMFIKGGELMINEGTEAKPYTHYFKRTFPIPEAVQALDGYGQGISKEYCNKIVLDPTEGVKKFVKNVSKDTFDGDESGIAYVSSTGLFRIELSNDAVKDTSGICNLYGMYVGNYTLCPDQHIMIAPTSITKDRHVIFVKDRRFSTVEEFKAYLSSNPMQIDYRLATPIETDLSDYFGEDNLIGVEGGGTVTMVNEYEYDVPSVIEYTVKGVDAI